MELKMEEIPNANSAPVYQNYWSGSTTTTTIDNNNTKTSSTTKKVTFNDILTSLNMVVNKGVLQFAQPVQKVESAPLRPNVRPVVRPVVRPDGNSYIHNKYFKDYVEPNSVPVVRRQMTKAEYLKQLYNQQQIAKSKSKKLLFDTQHIAISPHNPNYIGMNKMFITPYRRK